MKKLALAAAALALSLPAQAKKVADIEFTDTVEVGGQTLKLNGAGIRKKFVVKVYAGGLYLSEPSGDPEAIVAADAAKHVRMVFLRDVSRKQILDTYREGFEKNSAGPGLAALLALLDRVAPAIRDMKSGGEMTITYLPGQGTTVAAEGGDSATVEGKELADGFFRIWLGKEPADGGLKQAMLGK